MLICYFLIEIPKVFRKTVSSKIFQIHKQESNISYSISIPKSVVKFNAIKYWKVFCKANMLHMKIPMAVPYLFTLYPVHEKRPVRMVKIFSPLFESIKISFLNCRSNIFLDLCKIFIGINLEYFRLAKFINIHGITGFLMESCKNLSNLF